jgi:hypothetical protein
MNNTEARLNRVEQKLGMGEREFVSFVVMNDEQPHYVKDGKEIFYTPEAFPEDKFNVHIIRFVGDDSAETSNNLSG